MSERGIERPSIEEIDDELADRWEAMVEEADSDLREARIRLRWHQPELEVIKRAATRCGVSYQRYIRRAAFRQALADLKSTEGEPVVSPGVR